MAITLTKIKLSVELPADVFVEGETRPTRAKKAKAKTAPKPTEAADKKRSFSNTGFDVGDHRDVKTNRLATLQ